MELEQQVADLSIRQAKLQMVQQELAKTLPDQHSLGFHAKDSKNIIPGKMEGNLFDGKDSADVNAHQHGSVAGFSHPGEWSSSEGTGTIVR